MQTWGKGDPGVNRWAEIAEDIYAINVHDISGDGDGVLSSSLQMDRRYKVGRARGQKIGGLDGNCVHCSNCESATGD